MRLNRVELFYALVAAIGSESRRCLRGRGDHMHAVCMQRWLTTARPPAGAAGHGLATCKGRSAGLPPEASPAANRGGSTDRRGGRPLAWRLPTAKGRSAYRRGGCPRRWHAAPPPEQGNGGDDDGRGLGHPFEKRMIIPL
ncbi:hypothetical protein GW17_00055053 [Ensete ventricosum]|nr:hypothetical protein GW17_00055053 [Ensete ventricosum]